jgi:hypothetical protein
MNESDIGKLEAELLAHRVAHHSSLVEAARKSCISNREKIIRVAIFVALVVYCEISKIETGSVIFAFCMYFLVTYLRDNTRREKRIDALVALLGLRDGHEIQTKGPAEHSTGE